MNKFRNSLIWWLHEGSTPEAVLRGADSCHDGRMLLLTSSNGLYMSLMDTRDGDVWARLGSKNWGWRDSDPHVGCWSVNYEHS